MYALFRSITLSVVLLLSASRVVGAPLPILFVHGNGDSAAVWQTVVGLFESNGYDPRLLHVIEFSHPTARSADNVAEENRSSTADQLSQLAQVADALGANSKIILIGSSRGGYAVRNYVRNLIGGRRVETAILGGVPNHGIFSLPVRLQSEFNGLGPFLTALNSPQADPGAKFVTLRSDNQDKYAQPVGDYIGMPGQDTHIGYDGPALDGATNIILPGEDHRQLAFGTAAFAEMYKAVTGRPPARLTLVPELHPVLDGIVSGFANGEPTNLPIAGALVQIYEVDAKSGGRSGPPIFEKRTASDGRWGPFAGNPDAFYEFVVSADQYPITHIYRQPFPRTWRHVQLRLEPTVASNAGKVMLVRPQGYLSKSRDAVMIDGKVPELPDGVPSVARVISAVYGRDRPIPTELNGNRLVVRTFAPNEITFAQFND